MTNYGTIDIIWWDYSKEEIVKSLAAIGRWMAVNSESIYGTTASPFEQPSWGRYTKQADKLYAHVLQWPENGKLTIPAMPTKATQAYPLVDKQQKLKINQTKNGLTIDLPATMPDPIVSVVAIEYK
ncbi:alpha-L-fucosidase C-terminal domain-containing protein [Planctomycetota bacterium]